MKLFKRAAIIGWSAAALLLAAPVMADVPPIQELDSASPAPALSAGGEKLLSDAASKVGPAAAYAVDYVNFARNILLVATLYLTMRYIGGSSSSKRNKKRSDQPKKSSVGIWLFFAMIGLLITQALSFYLYDQESGPPGRMHKTVPLGHEYFVY